MHGTKFFQQMIHLTLLAENVRFNLIDSGHDLRTRHQSIKIRLQKICHTYRSQTSFAIFRLHSVINFVEVTCRLVYQQQIDIADVQSSQRIFNGSKSIAITTTAPKFCRDENFFAFQSGTSDSLPDRALVIVTLRCVYVPITNRQSFENALLTQAVSYSQ